jgi:methylmalonyl-CoA mutase
MSSSNVLPRAGFSSQGEPSSTFVMNETATASLTLEEFPRTTYAEWRAAAEESLKGAPFEKKLIARTHEGIDLQPIYNQSDLDALQLPEGWPGLPPYTRGTKPVPDRFDPWLVAQELPYGDVDTFNEAARADLMRGQNALNLLLDVATRRGLDPDQADAAQVSQCGLSISLLNDLERALNEIHTGAIPVMVWAGASALPLLGAFVALAERQGVAVNELRGGVLADPLTEYARDGKLPLSIAAAYKEIAETIRWTDAAGCPFRTVGVQGGVWADSGANAVEELAFALATATEYVRALLKEGVPIDAITPRFLFEFSLGSEIFPQIAKLRAARLLWAKIVEAFGGKHGAMFIHGRSSILNKATLDPHTNMLRATAEGFVGAIGGADSFHVAAFDEPIRPPDTFSRRIARNVHVILAEECGFVEPIDAAGGSWYIETITHQIAQKAWELFQEIEAKGGMQSALINSIPQVAAAKSAEKRRAAAATRRDGLIGVNLFPNPMEKPLDAPHSDYAATHAGRVAAVKGTRKETPVSGLRDVASVAAAWKGGASLNQIVSGLKRSGVLENDIQRIRVVRVSEAFEALRAKARNYAEDHGGNQPKIWLASFGPPKQCKARADFSSGFLAPGGFAIEGGLGAKSIEEAVEAAVAAAPLAVVICSSDDTYPEIVPAFVPALRAKMPDVRVILAGYPAEQIVAHEAAGVNDFIHVKLNCLEYNQALQAALRIA